MKELLIWLGIFPAGIAILMAIAPLVPFTLGILGVAFIWFLIAKFVVCAYLPLG